MPRRWFAALLGVALLVGCAFPAPAPTPPAVSVTGTVATGLQTPWGIAFLPDGSALISERDTARILRVAGGQPTVVGEVDGVRPAGEGGLLGLAYAEGWVFAYFTGAEDNRVVRMRWDGADLGAAEPVFTGIPKAGIHNGGRLAIGPDGLLYIATGDAGTRESAQDRASTAGKILRVKLDGTVPAENPWPGSPVFSLGHRNVQGLAFDGRNRLWASEFGQSDVDEVNLIAAGADYGWPQCEGACDTSPFIDPVVQWSPTSIASPSGLAVVGDYAYVASLRGETLWRIPLDGGEAIRVDLGDLGRLRTVVRAPDGELWLSTSNTDGRGDPRAGDDRVLRLGVADQPAGGAAGGSGLGGGGG